MATATLTSQLTNVLLDPGTPTAVGTGNAGASETAIHLEGANCAAMGHSGAVGPTAPTAINEFRGCQSTVTGFTRTDMHVHVWVRDLYPIRNVNVGGISIYLFGTSEAIYYMTGQDKGYGGGWFHIVINLDAGDRAAASLGTAPSSNITRIGMVGNISATKGESFLQNCYFDAIRRGTGGQGITFTGGTSGDRLTFANCADSDASSYGLLRNIGGAFFVEGCLSWGSATSTTYLQESLQTLNFANFTVNNGTGGNTVVAAVASDYYRIVFAAGTTGITNIDFTDVTFKGVSRGVPFSFNASALATGDAYSSTRTTYLFASTITLNSLCTSANDKFTECVTIIPGGITLADPVFSNCDAVTLTSANDKIQNGSTTLHNTATGIAYVTTNDLSKVESHSFDNTAGTGHAIEINTIGTYSFSGNQFTGYGADASNDAAIYNNSGGLVTINIVGGGGTPTVRNGAGASTTVNNSVTVKVSGVTEGTPITVIADETVGTVTKGDVILSDFADSNGEATTTIAYEGAFDPSGLDVISRARNQGVVVAAIADDGGVLTDETTEASSNLTADMTLLPAIPALNDAYYYAHNEQFNQIKQDVSTVLTFSAQPTILWEYWNGAAWVALAGVVDGTNGFETVGENIISYTLPVDWVTTTINAQGPLYYIRARLSVAGTITQTPIGNKATIDASRYLPYAENRVIVSGTGLADIANWARDTISIF